MRYSYVACIMALTCIHMYDALVAEQHTRRALGRMHCGQAAPERCQCVANAGIMREAGQSKVCVYRGFDVRVCQCS